MKIPEHIGIANLILIVFSSGIFLSSHLKMEFIWYYFLLGCSWMVAMYCCFRRPKKVLLCALLFFFLLGGLRMQQAEYVAASDIHYWVGANLELYGEIDEIPQVEEQDTSTLKVKGVLRILNARQNGQSVNVNGKVDFHMTIDKKQPVCHWGDLVQIQGKIMPLRAYHNPGLIDVEALKARQGIGAFCKGTKNTLVIIKEENSWKTWIEEARAGVLQRMEQRMPKTDAAALFAMLFGGYSGVRADLIAAFSATGIIHILSVSGSHVTLLAGTVQAFARAFRFPTLLTVGITVITIGAYAVFSGFCPPVVRSSLMGSLAFIAMGFQRQSDARYLLSVIALGMLAVSPALINDLSFQLSFGATAGLLYIAPIVRRKLRILPVWIAENLAVTIAAQLAVLPLLGWYFNQLPVCSLLANLVAVPMIEWVIIGGLFGAAVGAGIEIAGQGCFILCSLGIGMVYSIAMRIAQIPFGNLFLPSGGLATGCIYYLFLICSLSGRGWMKLFAVENKKMLFGLAAGLTSVLLLWAFGRESPLEAHFIDVGQGDAMVFITPGKQAVVIDTGGNRKETTESFDVGERIVVPYLRHLGVRKIQYLLLTHAHEDHAGGAAAILNSFPVEHVIVGREDQSAYQKVLGRSAARRPLLIPAYTGQTFTLDGVEFAVIHAAESRQNQTGNETSNVFSVRYGEERFLVTGDLTAEGEKAMLEEQGDLKCSVLKIAHHGSKTSSTEAFLDAAAPDAAIISVGAGNSFGHPSPEVLKRLQERRIPVWRTDVHGAVVVKCNRKSVRFLPYKTEKISAYLR